MKKNLLLSFAIVFTTIGSFNAQTPSLSISPGGPQCWFTGSSAATITLQIVNTPSNAVSYAWFGTPIGFPPMTTSSPSIVTTPSNCALFTVSCSILNSVSAVIATVSNTVNILCNPTISVGGSSIICGGSTSNLTVTGGATYTWQPGNFTGASFTVSPTTSTMYTVVAAGVNGCTSSNTIPVLVNTSPSLSILNSTSGGTVCASVFSNISATGAQAYVWSTGATTNSIVVTPYSSSCYTVTGTFTNSGCSASAVTCVSVSPIPNITIAGNNTVCVGSSLTFTASGATSYTWNTTPFNLYTPTINVTPTITTTYIAAGTGNNGCIRNNTITVTPNSLCNMVWPGDANSDGLVNTLDVLEIGLGFSSTGPARSPGGNSYIAQYAGIWTGTVSSGKNKCHADCNGDGIVNNSDTLAITANFLMPHSFKPGGAGLNPDISLVPAQSYAYPGQWFKTNVILGSTSSPISQIYGLVFDLNIDQTYLDAGTAYLVYTSSFLNAANQNVEFRKAMLANDLIYAASVRTDQNNVSGTGKIAELWLKVKAGAPNNASINLTALNAQKINNGGSLSGLSGGATSISVSTNLVGLNSSTVFQNSVRMFPNPTKGSLNLQSDLSMEVRFEILDIVGRIVLSGEFTGSKTIELSSLASGSYFVKFDSALGSAHKKLVVEE